MIIIPARLQSSRFPKKVLADIHGLPMVIRTAKRVESLDNVAVATDSEEILEVCEAHGIEAVMTSLEHQSGTDRINEAANLFELPADEVVVNVQADEPFIEPEVIQKVIARVEAAKLKNEEIMMVSCYDTIDYDEAHSPNLVKVVTDHAGFALYFSRSIIPYSRENEHKNCFGHLGIYGFTRKSLNAFCQLPQAPLEEIEKLEQLRALYHGHSIAMVEVKSRSFGIDTPEDLARALQTFR